MFQVAVGAMMHIVVACSGAVACPPLSPARPTDVPRGLPSTYDAGRGTGRVAVTVGSRDRSGEYRGLPNRRVQMRCADVEIEVATDGAGEAVIRGLPAGGCRVDVFGPFGRSLGKQWDQTTNASLVVRFLEPRPASVLPRAAATALPAGVVLERSSSGCLGPCRPFTATLHADGRVVLEREPRGRHATASLVRRWRVTPRAAQRAVEQARCLADGPSYLESPFDHIVRTVAVRVDDGVAAYHHTSDPAQPRELARRLRRLDQMLRLPPSIWTP